MANSDDEPDWAAIKADYLADRTTIDEICAHHGISKKRFHRRRSAECWPRRRNKGLPFRADLIARMVHLVEHQVRRLEARADDQGTATDKEVAQMSSLARTLEKLMELEAKRSAGEPAKKADSAEVRRMRDQLIKRMRDLEKQ